MQCQYGVEAYLLMITGDFHLFCLKSLDCMAEIFQIYSPTNNFVKGRILDH